MVEYMDGCWHCVHPQFLADQLTRSLERLRLQTLDVCLLHNPEYFFTDAVQRGLRADELQAARSEFYRRIQAAFATSSPRLKLDASNTMACPPTP
jgi:aryl-alcohol dehydrogenase-like predicted oxidoreductase